MVTYLNIQNYTQFPEYVIMHPDINNSMAAPQHSVGNPRNNETTTTMNRNVVPTCTNRMICQSTVRLAKLLITNQLYQSLV
jgi:hypothetical protein